MPRAGHAGQKHPRLSMPAPHPWGRMLGASGPRTRGNASFPPGDICVPSSAWETLRLSAIPQASTVVSPPWCPCWEEPRRTREPD